MSRLKQRRRLSGPKQHQTSRLCDDMPVTSGHAHTIAHSQEIEALQKLFGAANERIHANADRHILDQARAADRWLRLAVEERQQHGIKLKATLKKLRVELAKAVGDQDRLARVYEGQSPVVVQALNRTLRGNDEQPFQRFNVDWQVAAKCARLALQSDDWSLKQLGNGLRLVLACGDQQARVPDDSWAALGAPVRALVEDVASDHGLKLYRDPMANATAIDAAIERAIQQVPRGKRPKPQLEHALIVIVLTYRNLQDRPGWTLETGSPTGPAVEFIKSALNIYGLRCDAPQLVRQALERTSIN